ncbi:MAG: hypothetical protein WAQ52_07845 [Terriglobales bacterium]
MQLPAREPRPILGTTSVIYRVWSLTPNALRVERPLPEEILGLALIILIVAAGLFGLVYYAR